MSTTTPNLKKTHLPKNPQSAHLTVQDDQNIDDAAIAGEFVHDFAADAGYTLGTTPDANGVAEWQRRRTVFKDTGVVLTTGQNITVPDNPKEYVAVNKTAQILTWKTAAGSGVPVGPGKTSIVYCDGTNVERVTGDV